MLPAFFQCDVIIIIIIMQHITQSTIHKQGHSESADRIRSPHPIRTPDRDEFQNLAGTSLAKDTSVVKFQ